MITCLILFISVAFSQSYFFAFKCFVANVNDQKVGGYAPEYAQNFIVDFNAQLMLKPNWVIRQHIV